MTAGGGATANSGTLQITQPPHGLLGGPLLGEVAHQVVRVQLTAPVEWGDLQHFTGARPGVVNVSPVVPPDRLVDDDLGKPDHQFRPESGPKN
jgi:hypothetical protein